MHRDPLDTIRTPPWQLGMAAEKWKPLDRRCQRLSTCNVDLIDRWCQTCEAFVDEPRGRCVA